MDAILEREYQDEPVQKVDNKKGEFDMESVNKEIEKLNAEIENFKQLIIDAQNALNSAEKDMDDILSELPF